jgi:hypothetical protein
LRLNVLRHPLEMILSDFVDCGVLADSEERAIRLVQVRREMKK